MDHWRKAKLVGRGISITPHAHLVPVHLAGHAFAGILHNVVHHRVVAPMPRKIPFRAQPLPGRIPRIQIMHGPLPGRRDALRQNMHGVPLHYTGHHENVIVIEWGPHVERLLDTHDLRLFNGQRAGFVEEDMRHTAQVFKHVLRFDKDSRLGEPPRSGDIRDRSRNQQRTRRGQHQHLRESQWRAGNDPCEHRNRKRKNGKRHCKHVGGFHDGRP